MRNTLEIVKDLERKIIELEDELSKNNCRNCINCKNWNRKAENIGVCEEEVDQLNLDDRRYYTARDFGCNLWEKNQTDS